jgi:hypothetical protein
MTTAWKIEKRTPQKWQRSQKSTLAAKGRGLISTQDKVGLLSTSRSWAWIMDHLVWKEIVVLYKMITHVVYLLYMRRTDLKLNQLFYIVRTKVPKRTWRRIHFGSWLLRFQTTICGSAGSWPLVRQKIMLVGLGEGGGYLLHDRQEAEENKAPRTRCNLQRYSLNDLLPPTRHHLPNQLEDLPK